MEDKEIRPTNGEAGFSGGKKPKSKEEEGHMLAADQALSSVDTGAIEQNPASVERTLARLRELHGEVSGEAKGQPLPWYRRRPMLLAGSFAALAALVIGLVLFVLPGKSPVIEPIGTFVAEQGRISVITESGEVEFASEGDRIEVSSGSVIETRVDSRAILYLESKSEVRLDSSTSISIERPEEDRVLAELYRGNAYHRVVESDDYGLNINGLEVRGSGCAFNTDLNHRGVTVVATCGEVELVDSSETIVCGQGQKVVVERPIATARLSATAITPGELDTSWFLWNRDKDEESGYDHGILSDLPVAEPVEVTEPPIEEPQPGDDQGSQTPSVELTGQAGIAENLFNWNLTDVPGGRRLVLLRSKDGDCSYPANAYLDVEPNSTSCYDADISGGETCYYRLAVLLDGSLLTVSNLVVLNVPRELNVSLKASRDGNAVDLTWNWSANYDLGVTRIALVRSDDETIPAYPPLEGQRSWSVSLESTNLRDTDISAGTTYRYMIYLLSESGVVASSNEDKVVVPAGGQKKRQPLLDIR